MQKYLNHRIYQNHRSSHEKVLNKLYPDILIHNLPLEIKKNKNKILIRTNIIMEKGRFQSHLRKYILITNLATKNALIF